VTCFDILVLKYIVDPQIVLSTDILVLKYIVDTHIVLSFTAMDTAPLRSVVTCFWYPGTKVQVLRAAGGTRECIYIHIPNPSYPAGTKVQVLRAAGGHTTVFEQTLPAQHQLAPPLELQRYPKPGLNLSLNHPPKPLPALHSLASPLEPQWQSNPAKA
jgi:hypothetical protein